jgi:hypothetical protein
MWPFLQNLCQIFVPYLERRTNDNRSGKRERLYVLSSLGFSFFMKLIINLNFGVQYILTHTTKVSCNLDISSQLYESLIDD